MAKWEMAIKLSVEPTRVSNDTLFAQRFEYHRHLVSRRWQYFVAFVVLNGLLLTAWDKFKVATQLQPLFVTAMLLIACAFLRLVARCRRRILENARALNMLVSEPVLETGGRWPGPRGVTLWLYICIFSLSTPWLVILYTLSQILFLVIMAVYVAVSISVLWPEARFKDAPP